MTTCPTSLDVLERMGLLAEFLRVKSHAAEQQLNRGMTEEAILLLREMQDRGGELGVLIRALGSGVVTGMREQREVRDAEALAPAHVHDTDANHRLAALLREAAEAAQEVARERAQRVADLAQAVALELPA